MRLWSQEKGHPVFIIPIITQIALVVKSLFKANNNDIDDTNSVGSQNCKNHFTNN